ncbi:thioesterase family protein [Rugamonas apoptosis]|uniref:Thioesterase family protein n=1 Tax=Rugamonas apoptosis TaxID=2758570 RepID=A0A7W2FA95_9BURK|nr:thioesterase family protein [Rugamonas apoptosis]MBA5688013.1 thioesterase family protein [Rugamonas apoptosis]
MYEKNLVAGWGDMDFNAHMRNTAYLDKSADVRMMYFSDCGFPMSEFMRRKLGPVVMKDEVEYFRECHLLDVIKGTLTLAGISDDGSRMKLRNEFYRGEVLVARVTSTVGWIDQAQRKLVCPPPDLLGHLQQLEHSADFTALPNSVR